MRPLDPPGKPPLDPPGTIVRSVARSIAYRLAEQHQVVSALSSVVGLTENDESDSALDAIGLVIEYYRVPVLRAEYEWLVIAATQLDSMDSLTDTGVERLVIADRPGGISMMFHGRRHEDVTD
ncbi:hypothetical protein ACFWPV_36865 [Streptomyces uncialis]|uniref:hypothetical protein n=1 Tax=Streptomyces uncialis TaxID=1048205 RepID=UPI003659C52F